MRCTTLLSNEIIHSRMFKINKKESDRLVFLIEQVSKLNSNINQIKTKINHIKDDDLYKMRLKNEIFNIEKEIETCANEASLIRIKIEKNIEQQNGRTK